MYARQLSTPSEIHAHRRELSLKTRELAAELELLSLRADKADAVNKEGANAARDEESRFLRGHQVQGGLEIVSAKRMRDANEKPEMR